ncbi:acyltransferase family protein [Fusobacterium russii]|uniref:acyltransferase family protein n=1 Tax=Fusobacterium russii TaxID=854 RepID=UPI0003A4DB65|nr:acyltransferase family protein [Fusobacterium russii]
MKNRLNIKGIDYVKAYSIIVALLNHSNPNNALYKMVSIPIFMIITGHNYMFSFKSKNSTISLGGLWDKNDILKKLKRVVIACLYIALFEIFVILVNNDFIELRSFKNILFIFLKGGTGPGSYYPPTLIQIILFYFPILLFFNIYIIKIYKNKYRAILSFIIVFIVEFLYEIIINYSVKVFGENIIEHIFRIVAMRQVVFLQMGIIFYFYREQILKNYLKLIPFYIISFIYGYLVCHKNYIFYPYYYWSTLSTPLVFLGLVIIIISLKLFNNIKENSLDKVIVIIGKSSYHIFLIQMAYYRIFRKNIFNNRYDSVVDILICVSIGILYYYIEPQVTKNLNFLVKKLTKKFANKNFVSNGVDKKIK